MENGSDLSRELRQAELKKESLERSCELAHAHASSVMAFTLKWKELEDHLDMIMKSLVERKNDIDLRQKLLDERETMVGLKESELISVRTRIEECNGKLDRKIRELGMVQNRIEDCKLELEGKKTELGLVRSIIEDCKVEHERKEMELGWVKCRIEGCAAKLQGKEAELISVQTSIDECNGELESKIEELGSVRSSIEECKVELEGKETELGSIRSRIEECSCEYETKTGELDVLIKSVLYWTKNLSLKKEELNSVEGLIEEKFLGEIKEGEQLPNSIAEQLELRKSELSEIENLIEVRKEEFDMIESHFTALYKCTEERGEELTLKQTELNSVQGSIKNCIKELRAKAELILSTENSIVKCCEELEQKKKELCSVQKSVEELSDERMSEELELDLVRSMTSQHLKDLKEKEQHFKERVKEFELKEKHFNSMQKEIEEKLMEAEMKEKHITSIVHPQVKIEQPKSLRELGCLCPNLQSCILRNGNELHELLDIAVPHYQTSEFSRAHGITNELPVIPSQIETTRSEHIPVSNTVDSTSIDHLPPSNTVALSGSAKFVLDLIRELYSDNQTLKEGGTDIEGGFMRNYIFLLERLKEAMRKIDPRVKAQAMKLAVGWKSKMRAVAENSLEVLGFLQLLVTYELVTCFNREEILNLLFTVAHLKQAPEICRALGFADMVPDFVQKLIGRNQHLEAIRFICEFKLIDVTSPVPIITQYLDNIRYSVSNISKEGNNSLDIKDKTIGLKIDSLRALIECIEDCKLESAIGTQIQSIQAFIVMLEREKVEWNQYVSASNPVTQQQLQAEFCNFGSSAPSNQPASGPVFQPRLVENYPSSSGTSVPGNIQNCLAMLGNENSQWKHYVPSPNQPVSVPMFNQQQGEQNSHKRPRIDPSFIGNYTPQVPALVNPSIGSPGLLYGPGVAANIGQGVHQGGTGYASSPGGWVHLAGNPMWGAANRDAQQQIFSGNQFTYYFQAKQN